MRQVFLPDLLFLPFPCDAVADGGEKDLHDQLRHRARQCAHGALESRPMESSPKDGGKEGKYDDREQEVIEELSNEGGDVGPHSVGHLPVGISAEALTDKPVEGIIQQGRGQKGHGTAQENKPGSPENPVEGGIVPRVGGDNGGYKEDEAGQKVDAAGQYRNAVGGAGTEVLGDDIHAHKG